MGTHKQKRWFIAPRNALTNESVFADLAQTCGATEDQIHRAHPCTDGKRYDVIEVAYETIAKLERSRPTYRFKFLVFRQIEGSARMEPWPFTQAQVVRQTKNARLVARAVKKMVEKKRKI